MMNNNERLEAICNFIENGVKIPCTDGVIIEKEVKIGKGTIILPSTIILGSCSIGENCVIGPSSYICDSSVGNNSRLNNVHCFSSTIGESVSAGPFVHIRPNSIISDNAHIGNFVEIKNSAIGSRSKLPHLLYIGDADIGKDVNFGCGSITVNYDGKNKSRTIVKDGAFIGCNSNLIAPVTIGENSFIAAGSTITENVPDDSLAIARARQALKENWVNIKKPYKRQHKSRGK